VLARLMSQELAAEVAAPVRQRETHPGRDRRYYRLTAMGRAVARAEAARLRELVELARARDLLAGNPP
jgi:DNA-binding PadR family transcriptional regulator